MTIHTEALTTGCTEKSAGTGRAARTAAILSTVLCIAAIPVLLCFGDHVRGAVQKGFQRCVTTVLPTLFPFLVLNAFFIRSGAAALLGRRLAWPMRRLFGLSGDAAVALLLGCVAGYPMGARCAVDLYTAGCLDREETERLLAFCNNTGPAFLIVGVGAGMWNDRRIGFLLYFAQLFAALLWGILSRSRGTRKRAGNSAVIGKQHGRGRENDTASAVGHTRAARERSGNGNMLSLLAGAVGDASAAAVSICGFITFFGVAAELPAVLSAALPRTLLCGFLEVTAGASEAVSGGTVCRIAAAGCVGWSGCSVHAQTAAVVLPAGLSMRRYFAGKFTQSLLTALFFGVMCNFL